MPWKGELETLALPREGAKRKLLPKEIDGDLLMDTSEPNGDEAQGGLIGEATGVLIIDMACILQYNTFSNNYKSNHIFLYK